MNLIIISFIKLCFIRNQFRTSVNSFFFCFELIFQTVDITNRASNIAYKIRAKGNKLRKQSKEFLIVDFSGSKQRIFFTIGQNKVISEAPSIVIFLFLIKRICKMRRANNFRNFKGKMTDFLKSSKWFCLLVDFS